MSAWLARRGIESVRGKDRNLVSPSCEGLAELMDRGRWTPVGKGRCEVGHYLQDAHVSQAHTRIMSFCGSGSWTPSRSRMVDGEPGLRSGGQRDSAERYMMILPPVSGVTPGQATFVDPRVIMPPGTHITRTRMSRTELLESDEPGRPHRGLDYGFHGTDFL